MVRSDLGSSGVAFSLHTDSGYREAVVINSLFGLGELAVGGHVIPDEFIVHKRLLADAYDKPHAIIGKTLGKKTHKMVYGVGGEGTIVVDCDTDIQMQFSLSDAKVVELAKIVTELERVYSDLFQRSLSVDVEWALEGEDLYVVQTRPETVHSNGGGEGEGGTVAKNGKRSYTKYILNKSTEHGSDVPILKGIAIGEKISSGRVKRLTSVSEYRSFNDGDILVVEMTTPDWEPIMKRSNGIITDRGSRTCHAAIVARELGINAIVGTERATSILAVSYTHLDVYKRQPKPPCSKRVSG